MTSKLQVALLLQNPIKMPIAATVFLTMSTACALFVFKCIKSPWLAVAITLLLWPALWMVIAVILDEQRDWPSWSEFFYLAAFSVPVAIFAAVVRASSRNHRQKKNPEHA